MILYTMNGAFRLQAINSLQVATGTGKRQIFIYQNLPSSFNKGVEASFRWLPVKGLELTGGYQYLVAKDRSVKDSIEAGNYPWYKIRDNATGQTYFPIQNFPKIVPSISRSISICPVISPR